MQDYRASTFITLDYCFNINYIYRITNLFFTSSMHFLNLVMIIDNQHGIQYVN